VNRVVVAVTGASGALYTERLLKALLEDGHEVHVILSDYGKRLLKEERDLPGDGRKLGAALAERYGEGIAPERLVSHHNGDLGDPLSSGTFRVSGMAVVPASMKSVGAMATGLGGTLIDRAAAVTLKERRPLVIVPRETPLNRIQLENLLRLHDAGAVILPADPPFYQKPQTFEDLGDFIASRVMDHLGIPASRELYPRWGE
jgi:4-hydroxy-3-polyprenylbenzoate decarboxylase